MTDFTFHEINAFTRKGMQVLGNPAAVTIVDAFPDDATMGQAAKMLASPMTTFVKPTAEKGVYELRHFSPDGDECHICGHATMAATEQILRETPELRANGNITFKMNPKFGVSAKSEINAKIDGDNISLTMPADVNLQPMTDPEFYKVLCEGLRVQESELMKPVYFSPRIRDLVVGFKNPEVLLALDPDFDKLKKMAIEGKFIHEGLMGTCKSDIDGFDVINRVFLPGIDVNEDVACGSANCSVMPFWAVKNADAFDAGKKDFTVIYPYPPAPAGFVGGVQDLNINVAAEEIILTGQAKYMKSTAIQVLKKNSAVKGPTFK